MSTLIELKRTAQDANEKLKLRLRRRMDYRILMPFLLIPFAFLGVRNIEIASRSSDASYLAFGVAFLVVAAVSLAVAVFWKDGKKEKALQEANSAAVNAYMSCLWHEAALHGIDLTSTVAERTDPLDDAYEFTALRHGTPIDVTVREFDNEVIFMMNGERMRRTTVGAVRGIFRSFSA